MRNKYRLSLLALSITCVLKANFVQAESQELNQINVEATSEDPSEIKKAGKITKTRRVIQDELIADSKDLVRYTPDVGISDNGRHNKGFAMRGVEGNRVDISIDGVSLPDFEENSLYARYGNFNSSRLTIDPELVQGIDLVRGADSFSSGSGALGGGVNYRTLGSTDLVFPENNIGGLLKSGYASKNREWVNTAGVGINDGKLDMALLYSQRRGKELKSLGRGEDIDGPARGVPDPSKHRNHSYLAKIAYLFNDKHKLSASFNGQQTSNITDERSYYLFGSQWRQANDIGKRHNLNLAYEYFPTTGKLSYIKWDYDYQTADIASVSDKGVKRNGTKHLYEVYDRRFKTEFRRSSLRLDSIPLALWGGEHSLSFRTALARRDFKNINIDQYYLSDGVYSSASAIQHPVRSEIIYFALQDKIKWNDIFSSDIGVRYDYTKFKPQALNASCPACSELPAKNSFKNWSGSLGFTAQLNPIWRLSYYLSTGFRVPSATEMYFTYKHPAGEWMSNPTLKAEKSFNQVISLQTENNIGRFNLNAYQTKYRDFLSEAEVVKEVRDPYYEQCAYFGCSEYYKKLYMQAVNIDKAKISGIDVTGKFNLGEIFTSLPQGLNVMGALGYSKGKLYGVERSLLSIQPMKVVLGMGYDDPEDRWGINARWTYIAEKKGKDAQIELYTGANYTRKVQDYPYLSGSASLMDIYGFSRVGKNIVLRAGVYNLFNYRYQTWDALRGINFHSTTNAIDREGKGLERYYAPGRHYAASVEIRF